MLSIVIPSRNERFLPQTVQGLLDNARGDIEIVVALDGYWPDPALPEDSRLRLVHSGTPRGMRGGINAAVALSRGEYVMKLDAHCMVDEGFDLKLQEDMDDEWVVIPRRKRLDAEAWEIADVGKPDVDYEYLSYPSDPNDFGGPGLNGKIWTDRAFSRKDVLVDENMSFQGSCWFMKRTFFDFLELMDEENYGPFWNEAQEIGLKAWLCGGKVMTNKKTWYAHLHKGKKYGRGYRMDNSWLTKGASFTKRWMSDDAWHKQTLPFASLIERFWPVPTWPDDRTLWKMLTSQS